MVAPKQVLSPLLFSPAPSVLIRPPIFFECMSYKKTEKHVLEAKRGSESRGLKLQQVFHLNATLQTSQ